MQTIYRVNGEYFCNLQRAMDYAEAIVKEHAPERSVTAWRKRKNGLAYVARWDYEGEGKRSFCTVAITFIDMERRVEWKKR